MHLDLGTPGPACRFNQPFVARAAPVGDAKSLHDLQYIRTRRRRGVGGLSFRVRVYRQIVNFLFLAAKQGKNSMRRKLVQGLTVIEIVLEFFSPPSPCRRGWWRTSNHSTTSALAGRRSDRRLPQSAQPGWDRAPSSAAVMSGTCLSRTTNVLATFFGSPCVRRAATPTAAQGRLPWRSPPWCGVGLNGR